MMLRHCNSARRTAVLLDVNCSRAFTSSSSASPLQLRHHRIVVASSPARCNLAISFPHKLHPALYCPQHSLLHPHQQRRHFASASSSAAAAQPAHLHRQSLIRNIGLIAHIDAGKTTTAERLLYYSRRTRVLGDVDRGDTLLDYMREERERGITIQAACVTFHWTPVGPQAAQQKPQQHRLNLIDTPGHVDFTQQVSQSLRVLDGAILVLDGVKGVEAQTLCVWSQASTYDVPRIAFVNKMDRDGAGFEKSVASIRDKLRTTPLVLTLPLFSSSATGVDGMRAAFVGLIDLVRMETWTWKVDKGGVSATNLSGQPDDGSEFDVASLAATHESYEAALAARAELLEKVSEVDDRMMELLLEVSEKENGHLDISSKEIKAALRRIVVAGAAIHLPSSSTPTSSTSSISLSSSSSSSTPSASQPYTLVMCGSSRSNKGVQYLLNSIVDYLPSPLDRKNVIVQELMQLEKEKGKKGTSAAASSSSTSSSPSHTSSLRSILSDPSKSPLLALAFKVTHDLGRGAMPVVYCRVYNGVLKKGEQVVSLNPESLAALASPSSSSTPTLSLSSLRERPQKLLEIEADNLTLERNEIEPGNIGALVGLKHTKTGDTILSASATTNVKTTQVLRGMEKTEPVFFCSVEAASISAAKTLDLALACLVREDPSLQVSTSDSGQTILAGMGELHLDIIRSRLTREFGLGSEDSESTGSEGVEFGKMRISYKEGLLEEIESFFTHTPLATDTSGVESSLRVRLTPQLEAANSVDIDAAGASSTPSSSSSLPPAILTSIELGIRDGLARGSLLGYPMSFVAVSVSDIIVPGSTQPALQSARACAARAVGTALRKAAEGGTMQLLEPLMQCTLTVSSSHLGDVLNDLTSKRRASILDVTQMMEGGTNQSQIDAEVPLASMLGYATVLRSTTQGNGSFSMQFQRFQPVPPHIQAQLIESPP